MTEPTSVRGILDAAIDIYALKDTPRAGWVKRNIRDVRHPRAVESVAEHVSLMSMLAVLFVPAYNERSAIEGKTLLDLGTILQIIAVHDLAEAKTGDTPSDGTENRVAKEAQERAVMEEFAHRTGNQNLLKLWHEFETGATPEAIFAKDLDKIEMFIQSYLYQKAQPEAAKVMDSFWENDVVKVKTPFGKDILREIMQMRMGLDGKRSFMERIGNTNGIQIQ